MSNPGNNIEMSTSDNTTNPNTSDKMREEMIVPATKFLRDAKVAESPLAKKVAFLESKGLNAGEIEEAMRRSKSDSQSPPPIPPPNYQQSTHVTYQRVSSRWKDAFIAVTVLGGVGLGAYHLVKKYWLGDSWKFPGFSLTGEKQIQEAAAQLESRLKLEHDKLSADLQELKDLIPKMLEKSKESHSFAMTELQGEIKSLKSLLLSRRAPSFTSTAAMDALLPSKPQIPSWQLSHSPSLAKAAQDDVGDGTGVTNTSPYEEEILYGKEDQVEHVKDASEIDPAQAEGLALQREE